jgi:acyl dehydratase
MNEVWKKPPVSLAAYQDMVGKEVGVSSWHLVDQSRINNYADVIEDHQFIHIDPERAKRETTFGTTVAHGFLTMSLLSIMSYEVMPVIEGTTMGGSQAAQTEGAAIAQQCHGRDRGRGQARAGRRLDRAYLFRIAITRHCRA